MMMLTGCTLDRFCGRATHYESDGWRPRLRSIPAPLGEISIPPHGILSPFLAFADWLRTGLPISQ